MNTCKYSQRGRGVARHRLDGSALEISQQPLTSSPVLHTDDLLFECVL